MRTLNRSFAFRFFIQPMNYKPSHGVILSQAEEWSEWGERHRRLRCEVAARESEMNESISDYF